MRSRRQVFTLTTARGGEIDVILGVNGYIWISKHVEPESSNKDFSITRMEESLSNTVYSSQNDDISAATRREIARVSGCIRALVEAGVKVDEEMVVKAYEAALDLEDEEEDESLWLGGEAGRKVVELAVGGMIS